MFKERKVGVLSNKVGFRIVGAMQRAGGCENWSRSEVVRYHITSIIGCTFESGRLMIELSWLSLVAGLLLLFESLLST